MRVTAFTTRFPQVILLFLSSLRLWCTLLASVCGRAFGNGIGSVIWSMHVTHNLRSATLLHPPTPHPVSDLPGPLATGILSARHTNTCRDRIQIPNRTETNEMRLILCLVLRCWHPRIYDQHGMETIASYSFSGTQTKPSATWNSWNPENCCECIRGEERWAYSDGRKVCPPSYFKLSAANSFPAWGENLRIQC